MKILLSPFIWVLNTFYNLTGSYGLALILFAIVVKIILFPFQLKGKKSMIQMNLVSGQMQRLQKQYGKDRERYNLEVQKLYEREHINPMSGCLWSFIPLLILLPLYSIIREPLVYLMNVNADSPKDDLRDRFILSKGHCVEALYVTLESKGFITEGILDTLGQYGSILSGHPTIGVPGIEVNTGALGHGLSVGVGIAIAAKMDNRDYKTYVLMGDGEQGEGSIYEAAMAARQYRLDNLVAIIDRNHLQISGNTEDVMGIDDIHDRWTAFGWEVKDMNGDDMEDIIRTFRSIDYANRHPHLLVAHTTKGKGVSFMEGVAKWHHGVPSNEQYEQAIQEISERIKDLEYN